jgi:hypothetical protein
MTAKNVWLEAICVETGLVSDRCVVDILLDDTSTVVADSFIDTRVEAVLVRARFSVIKIVGESTTVVTISFLHTRLQAILIWARLAEGGGCGDVLPELVYITSRAMDQ